ncbi:MAG: repeat-containing protein [Myxococcales bacterium]|nr:repeat-containing protein [Myxococcales bacterium]
MAFNKEKVMDAARKFVDKGQIDKAVKEYLRIVQEDPKDVRVWLKIGDLYAKKGAKQDATDTYLKVARFYHEQGFFVKAVAVYKQILKLDPRLVDVILKLAELYRQTGYMTEAMQHYESVAAHFHREGNTKEALDTVKKLVDLDPENIATRIKLAELYSKEGLNDEAITQFTVACETLRRQGRQDDFLKVAERLLWHKPDSYALMRELAGLYLRRNDPRRALQKLQASFKADPRDVETLGLLAQAFQALDQKAKTVSVLKELARIHVENKHRDKASEVFKKILEFVPNDPDAIQFVGVQPVAPPKPTAIPRQPTPIPAAIRAATSEAKFNITTDLPSMASSKMTGSMPLVDEQSLSGVDFALPEYDDADFSADMEPPPDPRRASAAGERHADEISKILAETDVYVKYGLHQKAVDHLRRVFTLDTENVEAHERLKDIFISQGREQEAEVELLKLAELVAPSDPDRAEQYLQELLAMNGTHTGAFELARRYRLRVARMSSVSAEVEYQGGGVAAVDSELELDDLELSAPPPAMAVARGGGGARPAAARRDSIDDFDPNDIIGRAPMAHGSPAPGKPPRRPGNAAGSGGFGSDELDLEFEPSPSQATRQMSPDQVSALAGLEGDDEDEVLAPRGYNGNLDNAVDQQLDDSALGDDIDQQVAAELGASADGEDLPFDPDEARRFDQGTDAIDVSGFEETDMPQHAAQLNTPSYEEAAELAVSGSYDPYGTEAVQTPPYDPTVMGADIVEVDESDIDQPRAESTVEDDLDEADFYASQGMYPEALDVLRGLLERYPHHPLVNAKAREMELQVHGVVTPPAGNNGAVDTGTSEPLDIDEIEEMDEFEVVEDSKAKRKPSVMLERPVDEGDAETHYDLGLAYKEMGLYDEAIKAFEKVLRVPNREVNCRVMLGMCQREMGNPSEAINHFKAGLHAEPSERERLSLYYEIGMTYESMGDGGEALYYFEAVLKRDPSFADAARHAETLRARVGHATPPLDDDGI